MNIAVVTDSTASLPHELRTEHGIVVVPLHLVVDGQEQVEGDDVGTDWVVDALRRKVDISTSRPAPVSFLRAYEQAAKGGADAIISVHLSTAMSGTADSARSAALESPVPVHVVDSRTIGMAVGFAAVSASRDAAAGRDVDDVLERLERRLDASSVRLLVHSLDRLRRGGRIGGATALLGSALAVKPVLHVQDGRVEPLERVRTASRAIARLQALTVEHHDNLPEWAGDVDIAVQHVDAGERAQGPARTPGRCPEHQGGDHPAERDGRLARRSGDDRRRHGPAHRRLTIHSRARVTVAIHTGAQRPPPTCGAA
uniref:DegV family protein n=1 Tax=Janibacter limosus TaxID=53458 RepID=A0AC61U6Y1_9MICO|nr:DegV family protein [Janibacter limosus]